MDDPRDTTQSDPPLMRTRYAMDRPSVLDGFQDLRVAMTAVLTHTQLLQRRLRQGTLTPDQLTRGIAEIETAAKRLAPELARRAERKHH